MRKMLGRSLLPALAALAPATFAAGSAEATVVVRLEIKATVDISKSIFLDAGLYSATYMTGTSIFGPPIGCDSDGICKSAFYATYRIGLPDGTSLNNGPTVYYLSSLEAEAEYKARGPLYFQLDEPGTVTFSMSPLADPIALRIINVDPVRATSEAPEPASWALMITGFGAIGGVLRRRRTTTVFA